MNDCAAGRTIIHPDSLAFPGWQEPCARTADRPIVMDDEPNATVVFVCTEHEAELDQADLLD